MNNPPTAAAIAAFRQLILNNRPVPYASARTLTGSLRIRHVRESDFALKILFEEMTRSNLDRKDIEDMYNYAMAPHYASFGRRTYYALNDRFKNRHRSGREHDNWKVVDLSWRRLNAAAQAEKQSVLASLCAAASAMGIAIHRLDAQGGAVQPAPVQPAVAAPAVPPVVPAPPARPPPPVRPPVVPAPAAPRVRPPVAAPAGRPRVPNVRPPVAAPIAPPPIAAPVAPAASSVAAPAGSSQAQGASALPSNAAQATNIDSSVDAQSSDRRSSGLASEQYDAVSAADFLNWTDNSLPGVQYQDYLPSLANHPIQPNALNALSTMPDLSFNAPQGSQQALRARGHLHQVGLPVNHNQERLDSQYVNLQQPPVAPLFDANGDPLGHHTDHNLTLSMVQNVIMLMYAHLTDDDAEAVTLRFAGYLDAMIAELDQGYQRLCPWLEAVRLAQYWIGN